MANIQHPVSSIQNRASGFRGLLQALKSAFQTHRNAPINVSSPSPSSSLHPPSSPIPNAPLTPHASLAPSGTGHYYEALRQSKDRTPIPARLLDARQFVVALGRRQLIALARYLYDNYGLVGYAVNQIAFYSTPIKPQAATDDPDWNTAAEDYFADWSQRADFSGRFDFDTLQALVCKAIDVDGDIAAAMTSEAGFPQVQLIEGWRLSDDKLQAGHRENVFDGVQLDAKGRVLGYWIEEPTAPRFLSASELLLLFDPDRASSYRGVSPLRRGMNDIRDAQDIKAFEKLAVKINSALCAVLKGGQIDEDVWGNDTGTADNPGNLPAPDDPTATPQDKKLTLAELLAGDIPLLDEGQELQQLAQNRPGGTYQEFLDSLVAHFVAGLDIPPAFFLDQRLTGPNQRSVNGKAQRKFNQRQRLNAKLVKWAWLRVIGDAIDTGQLDSHPQWTRLAYQFPAEITIDLGDMESADREAVASGLKTRQAYHGKRGGDWQRETDQSFAEDRYIIRQAKQLAAEQGVPLEVVLKRYGFDAAKSPQSASQPDPAEEEPEGGEPKTPNSKRET